MKLTSKVKINYADIINNYNLVTTNNDIVLKGDYYIKYPEFKVDNIINYNTGQISLESSKEIPGVNLTDTSSFVVTSLFQENILTNLTRIPKNEVGLTVPSIVELLKQEEININTILNRNKPWEDWSLLSTYSLENFSDYFTTGNLYYDGTDYTFDTSGVYFTKNEVTNLQKIIKYFYNKSDTQSEINKINELREIESGIYNQLEKLVQHDYFWENTEEVFKNIAENFKTTSGFNAWTVYKGAIMTNNSNTLEYLEEDSSGNFDTTGEYFKRNNYLNNQFSIKRHRFNESLLIKRNNEKIENQINSYLNKSQLNEININSIQYSDFTEKHIMSNDESFVEVPDKLFIVDSGDISGNYSDNEYKTSIFDAGEGNTFWINIYNLDTESFYNDFYHFWFNKYLKYYYNSNWLIIGEFTGTYSGEFYRNYVNINSRYLAVTIFIRWWYQ